jgi:serine/threonine protein kinase
VHGADGRGFELISWPACVFSDLKKHTCGILAALACLHREDVIHRDIKPHNLLYAETKYDAVVKVADFGLARDWIADATMTRCGTAFFHAPEVASGKYDCSMDIYAFGKTLDLLSQEARYGAQKTFVTDLYSRCCKMPPSTRPTAMQLLTELCGESAAVADSRNNADENDDDACSDDSDTSNDDCDDDDDNDDGQGTSSSASSSSVYVTSLIDKRGKYHSEFGCSAATSKLALQTAHADGRGPCSKCDASALTVTVKKAVAKPKPKAKATTTAKAKRSSAKKMWVYVTSTDKRGKYHSVRECFTAELRTELKQAKKEGREKHC